MSTQWAWRRHTDITTQGSVHIAMTWHEPVGSHTATYEQRVRTVAPELSSREAQKVRKRIVQLLHDLQTVRTSHVCSSHVLDNERRETVCGSAETSWPHTSDEMEPNVLSCGRNATNGTGNARVGFCACQLPEEDEDEDAPPLEPPAGAPRATFMPRGSPRGASSAFWRDSPCERPGWWVRVCQLAGEQSRQNFGGPVLRAPSAIRHYNTTIDPAVRLALDHADVRSVFITQ